MQTCGCSISITYLNVKTPAPEHQEYIKQALKNKHLYTSTDDCLCSAEAIRILLNRLPLGKPSGSENVSAEHVIYADPEVCCFISLFVNVCLIRGHWPKSFLDTIITPIVKSPYG